MKKKIRSCLQAALLLALATPASVAFAGDDHHKGGGKACNGLPDHAALEAALDAAVSVEDSGLDNHMWATVVNRDGVVCAVAFSGTDRFAQWGGSRAISAQKANTANAFSLDAGSDSNGSGQPAGLALSTANLFSAVQPGGSLYGLQHSNPVDPDVVYKGPAKKFGKHNDPMVGKVPGGVNVFGGGLALYGPGAVQLGGVGVSGDTSCADHHIGWRVRNNLGLDHLFGVGGVNATADPDRPDNIIYDIAPDADGHPVSTGGFGHPTCLNTGDQTLLPVVQ